MRPFVIVKPNEAAHRPGAMVECPLALQRQAFIVDRPKEPLDLAIRLGATRPEQMMDDPQALARLLEARQALAMPGVLHREGQRVVGQYGLHAVRQLRDDLLE